MPMACTLSLWIMAIVPRLCSYCVGLEEKRGSGSGGAVVLFACGVVGLRRFVDMSYP